MSRIIKKVAVLVLCGTMLLGFPLQAFCVEPVGVLSYDMLEKEMMAKNPDILDRNKSYGRTVDNADRNNSWSISITSQGISTEKSNYQTVWTEQKAFANYNDLKRTLYLSQAKEAQLTYQLKITTLKESVGRETEENVVKAENALSDQKKATVTAQDNLNKALRDFNLALGQDVDTPLTIESVPEPDLEKIKAINADEDYTAAKLKCYEIRIAELPGNGYDDRQKETVYREFKDSFYSAYKALQDALVEYGYSQKLADIAQHDYEIARKKLGYGILSQLDYVNADYTWNNKLAATVSAKEDLFLAYQKYEWAKRGLIFS
ncbi:MAG: hypothetical protein AWM53_01400 [Candidatus Dichloromethanomonas elyunquensis]|nr:MAG: hypothetical protein AWM53_01400 [Candidatus Dichloromethanomonas elyunquensis]